MELVGMIFICGFFISMGGIGVAAFLVALAVFGVAKLAVDQQIVSRNTLSYTIGICSVILALAALI